MDKKLQPVVAKLEKTFDVTATEYRGDVTLEIPAEKIVLPANRSRRWALN